MVPQAFSVLEDMGRLADSMVVSLSYKRDPTLSNDHKPLVLRLKSDTVRSAFLS